MIIFLLFPSLVASQLPVTMNRTEAFVAMSVINKLCPLNDQKFGPNTCDVLIKGTTIFGCDQNGSVVYLSLYQRACDMGYFPTEIGLFPKLGTIDVRNANIRGTIPDEIANLASLTLLLVYGNKLRGVVPKSIERITKNLIACSFMRNGNETNCFDCPAPTLSCTSTFACSTDCLARQLNATTQPSTTSSTTTTTVTDTQPTTTESSVLISTTTTTKPSLIETTAETTTSTHTTTTQSYQMRTFTHMHATTVETSIGSTHNETTQPIHLALSIDGNVQIIIALACVLVVAIPVIVVLLVMYESARVKSGAPKRSLFSCLRGSKKPDAPVKPALENSLQNVSEPETEGESMEISDEMAEQRLEAGIHAQKPKNQYDVVPKLQEPVYTKVSPRAGDYQNVQVRESHYIMPYEPFTDSIKKTE